MSESASNSSKLLDNEIEEEVFKKGGLAGKYRKKDLGLQESVKVGAEKHKKWADLQRQKLHLLKNKVPFNPDEFEIPEEEEDEVKKFNEADFEKEDY